ncbi:aldehyde dehydrogenase family protein [bacterium]|nr:aldehyde dehydrogenase family protein [bacterium]
MEETLKKQKHYFYYGEFDQRYQARINALTKLQTAIKKYESRFLEALALDCGKPRIEAFLSEVYFVNAEIKLAKRHLKQWMQKKKVSSPFFSFYSKSYYQYQPYGQTLIIGPWNYPVQLTLGPLVSALAAGNVVTLKPSEHTPYTAKVLDDMIKATFKPEHVHCIQGDSKVAQVLLAHDFDKIFFTGSTVVGEKVAQQAAKKLIPVTLELGGKSPCIIDHSADLDAACKKILSTKLFNAGQTCVAPDYVCLAESIKDRFKETMLKYYQEIYQPHSIEKWSAKIINLRHFKRLKTLLAKSKTLDLISLGKYSDVPELYLPMHLVFDTQWNDAVMQEEIFGPILPVITFSSLDELVANIKSKSKPLSLSVFSKDKSFIDQLAQSTQSGCIDINTIMQSVSNIHLPFGGVGQSGMGNSHGYFGFKSFSYTRAYTQKIGPDFFSLKPPYENLFKWLHKIMH